MQTAWLIKMISTISNYATNTMQTSSLSLKTPSIKHPSRQRGARDDSTAVGLCFWLVYQKAEKQKEESTL